MSFLKQILSPFVEFTDEKKPETVEENHSPTVDQQIQATDQNAQPSSVSNDPGGSSQKYFSSPAAASSFALPEHQKHFEQLIEEANTKNPLFAGTDFKEFMDTRIDINDIADEATKYRTAFNVLKRSGLTKEKLVTTGQEYINLIGQDMNGFQGAYSQQYGKEVKGKEQVIQKKEEEMKALTAKLAALNTEIKQITGEIVQTKHKLDQTKNSFLLAGENKQKEIQAELQKIAQYF